MTQQQLSGSIIIRIHLRRVQWQTADQKTRDAIDKALANTPEGMNFVENLTLEGLKASQVEKSEVAASINWQSLLKWLVDNLPSIIALIMALFGV